MTRSWFSFRMQDILLAVMFTVLVVLAHDINERWCLAGIAFLQLIEGKYSWLDTLGGRITSIGLQLVLCFLLIGSIESEYYPIVLLPVASTATYLGLTGTMITTVAAIGAYLTYLTPLYIDWRAIRSDRGFDTHAGVALRNAGAGRRGGQFSGRSPAHGSDAL